MTRQTSLLGRLGRGCAVIPLCAGVAFSVVSGVEPWIREEAIVTPRPVVLSEDARLIDEVLSRRASNLGLTLRRQLGQAISEEAASAGYDPLLVLSVIDVESEFEEEAVSSKGARGLMQIIPSTLHFRSRKEGLRLSQEEVATDPALCVRLGIRYLRVLHDRFGDLELALMAYNAGPAKIARVRRAGNLDTFRGYPRRVQQRYLRFREGLGLGGDWALALREPALDAEQLRLR